MNYSENIAAEFNIFKLYLDYISIERLFIREFRWIKWNKKSGEKLRIELISEIPLDMRGLAIETLCIFH